MKVSYNVKNKDGSCTRLDTEFSRSTFKSFYFLRPGSTVGSIKVTPNYENGPGRTCRKDVILRHDQVPCFTWNDMFIPLNLFSYNFPFFVQWKHEGGKGITKEDLVGLLIRDEGFIIRTPMTVSLDGELYTEKIALRPVADDTSIGNYEKFLDLMGREESVTLEGRSSLSGATYNIKISTDQLLELVNAGIYEIIAEEFIKPEAPMPIRSKKKKESFWKKVFGAKD